MLGRVRTVNRDTVNRGSTVYILFVTIRLYTIFVVVEQPHRCCIRVAINRKKKKCEYRVVVVVVVD